MAEKRSRAEQVREISRRQLEIGAAERRKNPQLYTDTRSEILFVENVAELLGCSVDYVRRIPRRELPAAKCGPRLQYLKEDVLMLLRRRRDLGTGPKIDLRNATPKEAATTAPYDPVADARKQLRGKSGK